MLEIILVRHGETESNIRRTYCGWTDVELNEKGLRQAAAARRKLAGTKADALYSSPLKRASKTAEIINEALGLEIQYSDKLKERNFGIWDNLEYGEIEKGYPEEHGLWLKDWVNYCVRDGESAMQQYERVVAFIKELSERHESGAVVLVTHLGAIRIILSYLLGLDIEGAWHFKAGNGSITKVEIDHGYGVLTLLNG